MTPIERANECLDEFEFILTSTDVESACKRVGRHPRSVLRWYRTTGRTPVAGLATAITRAQVSL